HGGVQGQRRELLTLGLGDGFSLPFGELAQPAHQVLGVAPHGETQTAFHGLHDTRSRQGAVTATPPCSAARRPESERSPSRPLASWPRRKETRPTRPALTPA